ncbi:hypothetical protein KEM52_006480 [Ascosphaera acerosa]|nr:hypothetical protein KEM52_006480 [Ascosphaera acerosa]
MGAMKLKMSTVSASYYRKSVDYEWQGKPAATTYAGHVRSGRLSGTSSSVLESDGDDDDDEDEEYEVHGSDPPSRPHPHSHSSHHEVAAAGASSGGGGGVGNGPGGSGDGGMPDDENAFAVLMRIHMLIPLSLIVCFYSCALIPFIGLVFPLRLCPPSPFFSRRVGVRGQICRALGPLICSAVRSCYASRRSARYLNVCGERERGRGRDREKDVEAARSAHHNGSDSSGRRLSTTKAVSAYTEATPTLTTSLSAPAAGADAGEEMPPNIFVCETGTFLAEHPLLLLLVGIVSPGLVLVLAFMMWVAASFWGFSIIISDSDDGRAFVLTVRDIWIRTMMGMTAVRKVYS